MDGDDWNFANFPVPVGRGRLVKNGFKDAARGDFEHGWDFVPGKDALVLTGREDQHRYDHLSRSGWRPGLDGYNWKKLWYFEFPTRTENAGNVQYDTIAPRRPMDWLKPRRARESSRRAPSVRFQTRSGAQIAVLSGQTVAYLEYTDGALNLVTIKLDGTEKKNLTNFQDGTWLQVVDWSRTASNSSSRSSRTTSRTCIMNAVARPSAHHGGCMGKLDAHWSCGREDLLLCRPDRHLQHLQL